MEDNKQDKSTWIVESGEQKEWVERYKCPYCKFLFYTTDVLIHYFKFCPSCGEKIIKE